MAKHMQCQEESLSHMAEKILDHEYRMKATEASLTTTPPQEAPNASKEAPESPLTPSYQASSTSQGPAAKAVKIPFRVKQLQGRAANKGNGTSTAAVTSYKAKYDEKRPMKASEKKDAHTITSKSPSSLLRVREQREGSTLEIAKASH
ncbi:hypothetical protein LIER_25799 [Lithospermum erythrorhizon]|uniref:Uncharacterized protein n=1 Tax=Lithospermum erythrorhizon TaxID=34254 RepID=A0AAV3R9H2_LITER